MRATRQVIGATMLLLTLAAGCTTGTPPRQTAASPTADVIRVAAFNFPESRLLAELYAQALAAADLPVAEVVELGSREIVEPALQQGRVDIVPEYAGSALVFLERNRNAANADTGQTHAALKAAFSHRGVTVGAPAPAQNQNAFVVTAETAADLDLQSLNDLRPVAGDLVLGGPPECPQRQTCLAGLRDVYGLEFDRFLSLERTDHVTAALTAGEIDVGVLFTTDPAILVNDFVVLADDRELQPAENIVPVVRTEVLERHGDQVIAALERVGDALTTAELARLNQAVAENGQPLAEVARAWLQEQGITP